MARLGRELGRDVRYAVRALLGRPDRDRIDGMAAAVGLDDDVKDREDPAASRRPNGRTNGRTNSEPNGKSREGGRR
jgi:hypothetical protein